MRKQEFLKSWAFCSNCLTYKHSINCYWGIPKDSNACVLVNKSLQMVTAKQYLLYCMWVTTYMVETYQL